MAREGGPDEGNYYQPPWDTGSQWAGAQFLPAFMLNNQWAQVPEWMRAEEGKRMQWLGAMLPWMQAYQQGQQWGSEFDWRKQMDLWSQGFQGEQFDWQKAMDQWSQGLQEQMFGWEQEQGLWGQGFQEQQLDWQKELEAQRLEAEREAASLQAFGRRWKPNTRWS